MTATGSGAPDDDGGVERYVIGPPPGELFSKTNDNSVAILLTYGTARVLLAGQPAGSGMIVMGLFSVELREELHGALVGALGCEEVLDR